MLCVEHTRRFLGRAPGEGAAWETPGAHLGADSAWLPKGGPYPRPGTGASWSAPQEEQVWEVEGTGCLFPHPRLLRRHAGSQLLRHRSAVEVWARHPSSALQERFWDWGPVGLHPACKVSASVRSVMEFRWGWHGFCTLLWAEETCHNLALPIHVRSVHSLQSSGLPRPWLSFFLGTCNSSGNFGDKVPLNRNQ